MGAENGDLANRLKHSEAVAAELQRRIDDLSLELNSLRSANNQLATDNMRMKAQISELVERNSHLEKDNNNLASKTKEI